jgi:formylglycine-generating enzyme required for sulfatase activity
MTTYGQVDIKEIDSSLGKVNNLLYASKFEVTNKLYNTFIYSLKKAKKEDQLSIARIDSTKWSSIYPKEKILFCHYHISPAFINYPVVNISHNAAILFCKWLTDEYNLSRKRKFKKVIFLLPTEKEWISAAQGGNDTAIFTWKGNDVREKNGKGLYRCNMRRTVLSNIEDKNKFLKSIIMTSPVDYYWPNKFGLYNMCGNVAEMLDDKNIVKGGSWLDSVEDIKISSKKSYDGSAMPTIGFRYFAEIIEK